MRNCSIFLLSLGQLMLVLLTSAAASDASTAHTDAVHRRLERSRSYSQRTSGRVFRHHFTPHWFGPEDRYLWYRVDTAADAHQFVRVDAVEQQRAPAFDHDHLARALHEATGEKVPARALPLQSLQFRQDAAQCGFRFKGRWFTYGLPRGPLREGERLQTSVATDGLSPQTTIRRSRNGGERTPIRFENRLDQKLDYYWVQPDGDLRHYGEVAAKSSTELSTFEGHAWLLKNRDEQAVAAFVASSQQDTAVIDKETPRPRPEKSRGDSRRQSPDDRLRVVFNDHNVTLLDRDEESPRVLTEDGSPQHSYGGRVWWAPDSKQFVVMRTVPGTRRTIPIVESSPEDSIHPRLIEIPYAKPGDRLDKQTPVLFRAEDDWKPQPVDDALFPTPFDLRQLEWKSDSSAFSFVYNERGHQTLRLIEVDAARGVPRVAIDEQSETFICYSSKSYLHRIEGSDDAIWMSERSGWNHLYLIDTATGEVKHPITSGQWVVRDVVRVDDQKQQMWLSVSGIDQDQDPYHEHLIRIGYDGSGMTRLTAGDGDHRWTFSPDSRYLIDTWSRVDSLPRSVLRDAETGAKVCDLEQADASELLETGWPMPERFVAKGRDGQTDIYGVIVRPTNFDPGHAYPVIEAIYAGPHGAFVPKRFGTHESLYEMAELGFIVVKIDGMGTNHRSKAFHDVCWQNLADSGFPDRITWIKAAAESRPEMDLSRIGIFGGSAGGQSAMRALIDHGDFYKAAAADCGCHDNRVDKIWWNEQWMGWPIGPHYEQQSNVTGAKKITGELLLIWGELDRNVDPASTMQVIDALVKADKDFEQLIIPGTGHGAAGHPYARRRQAEFFMRVLGAPISPQESHQD